MAVPASACTAPPSVPRPLSSPWVQGRVSCGNRPVPKPSAPPSSRRRGRHIPGWHTHSLRDTVCRPPPRWPALVRWHRQCVPAVSRYVRCSPRTLPALMAARKPVSLPARPVRGLSCHQWSAAPHHSTVGMPGHPQHPLPFPLPGRLAAIGAALRSPCRSQCAVATACAAVPPSPFWCRSSCAPSDCRKCGVIRGFCCVGLFLLWSFSYLSCFTLVGDSLLAM